MRRKIGILLSLMLAFICAYALADVAINETNFPDKNFRGVVAGFDTDGNGTLSDEELMSITRIECAEMSISSLKGIEHFTALRYLYCYDNQLTTLDVSKNTALNDLRCIGNQLTTLDVSKNTALTGLYCWNNQLTTLDVSKNTALYSLYCNDNQLTTLDVSKNTALIGLGCSNNQLTTLDVSKNTKLESLWCSTNQLKALDISKNTNLRYLGCNDNHLSTLDVNNKAIVWLECQKNNLKKLDISHVPALVGLVKETKPSKTSGVLSWQMDDDSDGMPDLYLTVDKDVDVITEKSKIDLSNAKVTAIKNQVYTGKAIKPTVTVKYDNTKLTKGTDYTVSYKNNKKIGTATVTITGKGNYTGKKTVKFDIVPKPVKLSSLTAGKKELTVKWIKGSNITGYEIEYSLKKDFKDKKTVTIKKAATTKTVLKKLQAAKTYYVRIRTYKTVNGKKYYSDWSAVKNKKTK